jgi:hypothetical protein
MAMVDLRDAVKVILRLLGFAVNGAVLCQAGWILAHPDTGDLSAFCNWLGQGILFCFIGMVGMVFEFWTFFQFSTKAFGVGFMKMVARRTTLAGFYFWMGCCAIGGMRASVATTQSLDNHSWQVVDSTISIQFVEVVVGLCAWIAAALNLLTSCCMGEFAHEEDDAEHAALLKKSAPSSLKLSTPLQDPFLLESGARNKKELLAAVEESKQIWSCSDIEKSVQQSAIEKNVSSTNLAAFKAPEGGWNSSVGPKPFGSA